MFAARANQENAIYEQQQAAAAKPLNQGIKGLAPKTPSNKQTKTLFGKARNDENANLMTGKAGAKDVNPSRNAFITPANPCARAPLGNKTTNAKALQKPAPLVVAGKEQEGERQSSIKSISPRLQRSKLKVYESTSAKTQHNVPEDPEERDIEYMPPREVPLPDTYEDHWPHECEFAQLRGKDLTRGWWSEFAPKKDEDESDLSDYDETCRQANERNRKEMGTKKARASKNAKATGLKSGPSATAAQEAASALSNRSANAAVRRNPSSAVAVTGRKTTTTSSYAKKPIFDRCNPRFTAAKAASNSTIGYSKGRTMTSSRRPLSSIQYKSLDPEPTEPVEEKTTIDHLLGLGSLRVTENDTGLGSSGPSNAIDPLMEDEEPEVFQLDPVQEF